MEKKQESPHIDLADSRAELSIIRKNKMTLNVKINTERRFIFTDIGDTAILSLEKVMLCVNGVLQPFQVVPYNVSRRDAYVIIGIPFLSDANTGLKERVL